MPSERLAVTAALASEKSERLVTVRLSIGWRKVTVLDRWVANGVLYGERRVVDAPGPQTVTYTASDAPTLATYRALRDQVQQGTSDLVRGRNWSSGDPMIWHIDLARGHEVAMNRTVSLGHIDWIVTAAAKAQWIGVDSVSPTPWEAEHSWGEVCTDPPSSAYLLTLALDVFDNFLIRRMIPQSTSMDSPPPPQAP